jgi:hypothetical protein
VRRTKEVQLILPGDLVKIEYSSEKQAWITRMKGLEGEFAGETPCDAAQGALDGVQRAFLILQCYGIPIRELVQHPPLRAVLEAYEADVESAHQIAHDAEQMLATAVARGQVS